MYEVEIESSFFMFCVQVDGTSNPVLQSVRFEDFPIHCAKFSQDGCQFIEMCIRDRLNTSISLTTRNTKFFMRKNIKFYLST